MYPVFYIVLIRSYSSKSPTSERISKAFQILIAHFMNRAALCILKSTWMYKKTNKMSRTKLQHQKKQKHRKPKFVIQQQIHLLFLVCASLPKPAKTTKTEKENTRKRGSCSLWTLWSPVFFRQHLGCYTYTFHSSHAWWCAKSQEEKYTKYIYFHAQCI